MILTNARLLLGGNTLGISGATPSVFPLDLVFFHFI